MAERAVFRSNLYEGWELRPTDILGTLAAISERAAWRQIREVGR